MTVPVLPSPFTRTPLPLLPGGGDVYLQRELDSVESAVKTILPYVPQPATVPPKFPVDGMIRLARSPWRPIGGSVDAWVFYDATVPGWVAL